MDSIPADMITFLVADTIRTKYKQDTKQVKVFVANAGSSGLAFPIHCSNHSDQVEEHFRPYMMEFLFQVNKVEL